MKKNFIFIIPVSFAIFLYGCNTDNTGNTTSPAKQDTKADRDTTPLDDMATFKFSYTIANLPSPMQVLDEVSKANLPVKVALLNPVDNVNKYHTSLKQAFNYGIYGVDMAYLVVNDRTMELLKYYNATKKLAEQLNVSETFNRFVTRFEANSENRDSLPKVIDEAYAATDEYLRSNERLATASQVLAGSWLEGQHITVNLLKDVPRSQQNEMLYQRVWEQRFYLENISGVLGEFKNNPELLQINANFEDLLRVYRELESAAQIDEAYLSRLATNLAKVRNSIIM